MSDEWKIGRKPVRVALVTAVWMTMTLLVGAPDTEPKLDVKVQALVDHLEAQTIDCPAGLLASDVADRTYCGTIDLDLRQLKKSVLKFIRQNQEVNAVQLGRWSELQGGLQGTPFLLDSLVFQMVFVPRTATLLLMPHGGCLKDSEATAPGLFEWTLDGIEIPERLSHPRPAYPERARAARVNGAVVLQAIIRQDGTTSEHCVLHVQPNGYGFAESALQALQQARYKPATRDGSPVEIVVTVASTFELR